MRELFGSTVTVDGAPLAPAVTLTAAAEQGSGPEAQALEHYRRSMERLRAGDWAGFGDALRQLEQSLQAMQKP